MRARLLLTSLLALAVSTTLAAHASPQRNHPKKRDMRDAIVALESQWRDAQVAGDVATMDKMLSDDYVGVSSTGEVNTKAQQLDRVRHRTLVVKSLDFSDIKVKFVGGVAIVTTQARIEGTNNGAAIAGNFIYTRVYQRTPSGQWKITSFEATRVRPPGARSHASGPPPAGDNPESH